MRRLALLVAVTLAATVFAAVPVVAEEIDPSGECIGLPGVMPYTGVLEGSVPVLMVHGFTGDSSMWFEPIDRAIYDDAAPLDRSFAEQLTRLDAVSIWAYDYHDTSARWVDDPSIGQGIADVLDCFAEQGALPAVVVGHSLGGLATRQALSVMEHPEAVAGVVTFGTPHLGSDAAAWIADQLDFDSMVVAAATKSSLAPVLPVLRIVLEACGASSTASVDDAACSFLGPLSTVFSEAGKALRTGSDELADLPPFPAGLPVLGIAGQVDVVWQGGLGFFYQDITHSEVGDVIVPEPSAIAADGETYVGNCQLNIKTGWAISDDLRQALGINFDAGDEQAITNLLTNACYHSYLTRALRATNAALAFISDIATRLAPPQVIVGAGINRDGRLVVVMESGSQLASEPIAFGALGGRVAGGRDLDGDGAPEIFVDERDTGSTVLRRVFAVADERLVQVGTMAFGGAHTEPVGAECVTAPDGTIEVRSWSAFLPDDVWKLSEVRWTIDQGHQVELSRRDFTVSSSGDTGQDLETPELAAFTTSQCDPTITFSDPFRFEWTVEGIAGLSWGADRAQATDFMTVRFGEPEWEYDNVDDVGQWCNQREMHVVWADGPRLIFDADNRLVGIEPEGTTSIDGIYDLMALSEAESIFGVGQRTEDPLFGWPMWVHEAPDHGTVLSGFVYPWEDPPSIPYSLVAVRVSVPGHEPSCPPVGT